MENNKLKIEIGTLDKAEYRENLHSALLHVRKMVFSVQSLELDQDDTEAVHSLLDFTGRLQGREGGS